MEIGTFLTTYIQDHFSIPAKWKNIELTCTIKKDFTLKTHTLYLQKIFWNLVKNAIAYTDEWGKIEVIIESKKVTIKDTGRWMTPDELWHIWDRFYRADASRAKGSAAGYGLGLAIVKKVIDEHNWKVSVDSEKGKGTEFKVSF
jgi:signal transduction histidine kinase